MDFKLTSIIIGKFNVGETDRLYVLYTKEKGKIILLGKGVRKLQSKLAGNLEPITESEIFAARSRGRGKITGAIVVNNFPNLKKNSAALEKVFSVLKIFNRLVSEEEKEEKIFSLLLKYLEMMNAEDLEAELPSGNILANEIKLDIFTFGFIFQLLHLSGYGLETKKCLACGKKIESGRNFFSPSLGGTVCSGCARRDAINRVSTIDEGYFSITDETIKFIRLFLENKLENLGKIRAEKENLKNLKLIADVFVKWIIN